MCSCHWGWIHYSSIISGFSRGYLKSLHTKQRLCTVWYSKLYEYVPFWFGWIELLIMNGRWLRGLEICICLCVTKLFLYYSTAVKRVLSGDTVHWVTVVFAFTNNQHVHVALTWHQEADETNSFRDISLNGGSRKCPTRSCRQSHVLYLYQLMLEMCEFPLQDLLCLKYTRLLLAHYQSPCS